MLKTETKMQLTSPNSVIHISVKNITCGIEQLHREFSFPVKYRCLQYVAHKIHEQLYRSVQTD